MKTDQSLIYIIILNYNGEKMTLDCLESLFRINYPNFKVVLVDNGSNDNTIQEVKKSFPQVKILAQSKNLGFAEGNNVGIRYALKNGADYILLLNNDTLVNPNFLDILVKNIKNNPEFSLFSPQMRLYPEKNKVWYAGGRIVWPLASVQLFNRGDLISKTMLKKPTSVSFIPGAAVLIKSNVFKDIGLLDKNYFLYWEETDFEARALKKGYQFLYVPDAVIWHRVAASSGGLKNPITQYYFYRNNLLFAKKNLNIFYLPIFGIFFLARILFMEVFRGAIEYLIGKKERWLGVRYIFIGVNDFFHHKFGPKKIN